MEARAWMPAALAPVPTEMSWRSGRLQVSSPSCTAQTWKALLKSCSTTAWLAPISCLSLRTSSQTTCACRRSRLGRCWRREISSWDRDPHPQRGVRNSRSTAAPSLRARTVFFSLAACAWRQGKGKPPRLDYQRLPAPEPLAGCTALEEAPGGFGALQGAPGGPRRVQEAPEGPRRPKKASIKFTTPQEAPRGSATPMGKRNRFDKGNNTFSNFILRSFFQ